MPDDPYAVLGVTHTASRQDIRRAYRTLAKQCHPDLHHGDKRAEARFKQISAAHDTLLRPGRHVPVYEPSAATQPGPFDPRWTRYKRPYRRSSPIADWWRNAGLGILSLFVFLLNGLDMVLGAIWLSFKILFAIR